MKPFDGAHVVVWSPYLERIADVTATLRRLGCRVGAVRSLGEFLEISGSGMAELVIGHVGPNYAEPLRALARDDAYNFPPLVILIEGLDIDLYLRTMHAGAFDCLELPVEEKEFARVAAAALRSSREKDCAAVGHC